MAKLNEPQNREHPWFKKHQRAADTKAKREAGAVAIKREKIACPHCSEPNCFFGECDGREF